MAYNPNFRGNNAKGSSTSNASTYQNSTVSTMPVATAVSKGASSNQMVLVDVTDENTVERWLGLTSESVPSSASGLVSGEGRLENIPLGLGFSIGDTLWAGVTPGSLTNVKPDLSQPGWASGYFVLFVGVVVQNQFNPGLQDIQIFRQLIGQL